MDVVKEYMAEVEVTEEDAEGRNKINGDGKSAVVWREKSKEEG